MRNTSELKIIEEQLKPILEKNHHVLSVYLYGSLVIGRATKKSDLDLFIILKNCITPVQVIKKLIRGIKMAKVNRKIDFDICFEEEAKNFLHRGKIIHQYITIGRTGRCIYGRPILKNVQLDVKEFYVSIASFAQQLRHEEINKFGEVSVQSARKKVLFALGSLAYLEESRRQFHPLENVEFVFAKYPSVRRYKKSISQKSVSLATLWEIVEELRIILERKMLDD